MTLTLALETWIAVAVTLVATSALLLLLIVVAPWRSVRQEPPLDDAIESRILLGEHLGEVHADEDLVLGHDDRPGRSAGGVRHGRQANGPPPPLLP